MQRCAYIFVYSGIGRSRIIFESYESMLWKVLTKIKDYYILCRPIEVKKKMADLDFGLFFLTELNSVLFLENQEIFEFQKSIPDWDLFS